MADYIYKSYFNHYERNSCPFDLAKADELERKHVAKVADKSPVVEANPDTLVLADVTNSSSSSAAAPQRGARAKVTAKPVESPVPLKQRSTIHCSIHLQGRKADAKQA